MYVTSWQRRQIYTCTSPTGEVSEAWFLFPLAFDVFVLGPGHRSISKEGILALPQWRCNSLIFVPCWQGFTWQSFLFSASKASRRGDCRDLWLQTHVVQEETVLVCLSDQESSLCRKLVDGSRHTFKFIDLNSLPGSWFISLVKLHQNSTRPFKIVLILQGTNPPCKSYKSGSDIKASAKLNMQINSLNFPAWMLRLRLKWFELANVCTSYFLHWKSVHVTLCLKDTSFIKSNYFIIYCSCCCLKRSYLNSI